MSHKILVIGGTGMLGLPVANQLKKDGFDVTILSTNLARAQTRLADKFKLLAGDVTDQESLKVAMDGQDAVYLNLNASLDPRRYQEIEIDGTANAARIAGQMGIKRIGHISSCNSEGIEKGIIFLDAKVKAERALIESGVPYVVMRPSWFFETLPHFIQGDRAVVLGKQPLKRSWLAAADFACQVSRGFQSDDAANKIYYNLGPQKMTIMEAVQTFCKRLHPDIKPSSLPLGLATMLGMIPGKKMIGRAAAFFRYQQGIAEDFDARATERILGPNLTTLEEWLENYGASTTAK